MKQSYSKLYNNPLSKFAGVMAVMVFIINAVLLTLDFIGVKLIPVIGVFTYTVFPALLGLYLLLIPVGMIREWRRRHRELGVEPPKYPRFDLNDKSQRMQLYVFILGSSLVGLLVLAISTKVYEYTESVSFCSETCHKVMEPEATTYRNSSHSRVACVKCHVGEGATWYVKSKLSGLYQIYAVAFNKFPTPIETPVQNLRPSSETCETCHWPSKFFGAREVVKTYYGDDEKNSPSKMAMLINIGGGTSPTGIHWHVGQDEVYYIARDKARQDIPWIKVKRQNGEETIYTDKNNPPSNELIAKGEIRKMDCIDCHNRPTHVFKSPKTAIDSAIFEKQIDVSLPFIKKIGVAVLSEDYDSKDSAFSSIRDKILSFYKEKYPKVFISESEKIDSAISSMQSIWADNNFPYMKSKWSVYPDNISHLAWPGCFRCHDENHINSKAVPIKKDCNICHIFLAKPFKHPVDVGGEEMKSACNMCHSGK